MRNSTRSNSRTATQATAPNHRSHRPTEYIPTLSRHLSRNGTSDTPYNGIDNAPFGRPDRHLLLETVGRNRASPQLHRPAVRSIATLCRHSKFQGACLRANPQNPPRLHFPHQRPRSFLIITHTSLYGLPQIFFGRDTAKRTRLGGVHRA